MERQSVLNKQTIKKRKKKTIYFPVFSVIRRIAPVFLKAVLLLVIVAGLSLSLMYGHHYFLRSSFTRLEQVEVAGVDEEIKRELIDMCNLGHDQNLMFINLNTLKQKMEKHPWVRSVKLERHFPHTLFVRAEKDSPFALVLRGGIHYMNRWCEIFKEVNGLDDIDFPVISGVSEQDQKARRQLQEAAQVMSVLESQKGAFSLKELSEIHLQDEEISLYFSHLAAEVTVMSADFSCKMKGLRKLARHLKKTGQIHQATCIDLNSVDGVVVSFRKG
jgi:cell division protein FtsQ